MKKKYFLMLILFIYIHNYSQIQYNLNKKRVIEYNQNKTLKSEEFYFKKGMANYKLNNFDDALLYFTKSIKLNSKKYNYYYMRGSCYLENRNKKKAISDFKNAIKLNTNYSNSYCKLGYAYYLMNDSINSSLNYKKSLYLNPNNSNTYYYQSLDFGLSMRNPEKKVELLTKAIDLANSIEFHSSFENIAEAYFDRGKIKGVLLPMLIFHNLHNESFNERKYLMEQMLDYTSAIKCNSKYSDAYYERGLLKNNKLLNDFSGAFEDFNKAIQTNITNGNAYIERGYLKLNYFNDGNGAIDDLIKSTKLETDFYHPKENTYTAIGIGLIELGKKSEGCKYLSKAGELGYEKAFNYINIYCK
ncbi:NrfG FOG, TPR repeat [Flavobacteriaceae bacterium]